MSRGVRTNGWVTSYNPAIASCIRSNHDITWIPTSSKALTCVCYLTNCATKADISPQQILVKGALIVGSMKSAGNNIANAGDLQQDSKFLLRWYNSYKSTVYMIRHIRNMKRRPNGWQKLQAKFAQWLFTGFCWNVKPKRKVCDDGIQVQQQSEMIWLKFFLVALSRGKNCPSF
jgi:hypothetical protein